jgi:AhpD family alkylhydroperoxidase
MSHARSEYNDFMAIAPDAYEIVKALGQAAAQAGIDKALLELIKLRASQINGCAFCVQFHILQGQRLGIAADKLNLVVVWREVALFSARERAALAWTEALTRPTEGVSDEVYAEARAEFSEKSSPISPPRSPRSMSGTGSASPIAGPRRHATTPHRRRRHRGQFSLPSWLSGWIASSGRAWASAGGGAISGPISRPRPWIKRS